MSGKVLKPDPDDSIEATIKEEMFSWFFMAETKTTLGCEVAAFSLQANICGHFVVP